MTKPIEGWVAWHLGKLPNCTLGDFIQVFPEQPPESGLQYRPVKITFTDELDTVVKYKRLEELRNEKDIPQPVVEKEIADAIREERERIWKAAWEVWPNWYPDLKTILFGEEK